MEQTLLKPVNKNNFNEELKILEKSCFSADLDFSNLRRQLPLLHDIIKQGLPEVRLVTSVDTIMQCNEQEQCSFEGHATLCT